MRNPRRDSGLGDLERALRDERPALDRGVEREIMARIKAHPARGVGLRVVLAGVMTAAVFGAIAAFGGASYATNAVKHSVGVTVGNKGWNYTPSYDQYGQKAPKGSGGKTEGEGRHGRSPSGYAAGVFGFGYGMFGIGGFRW
ncbi:MAG TPA: hypothetical protein VGJ11_09080 [Gaiellales bacterium]